MTLMKGLGDDLPLHTWLSDNIWPTEAKYLSYEFCLYVAWESIYISSLKYTLWQTRNEVGYFTDDQGRNNNVQRYVLLSRGDCCSSK